MKTGQEGSRQTTKRSGWKKGNIKAPYSPIKVVSGSRGLPVGNKLSRASRTWPCSGVCHPAPGRALSPLGAVAGGGTA